MREKTPERGKTMWGKLKDERNMRKEPRRMRKEHMQKRKRAFPCC